MRTSKCEPSVLSKQNVPLNKETKHDIHTSLLQGKITEWKKKNYTSHGQKYVKAFKWTGLANSFIYTKIKHSAIQYNRWTKFPVQMMVENVKLILVEVVIVCYSILIISPHMSTGCLKWNMTAVLKRWLFSWQNRLLVRWMTDRIQQTNPISIIFISGLCFW